jgi:hypothetical protein
MTFSDDVARREWEKGDDDARGHRGRGEHDRRSRESGREQACEHTNGLRVHGCLRGGKSRHRGDARERGQPGDDEHRRISGVCGEPYAEWKAKHCGDVDNEAVETESFASPFWWNDRGDE